MMQEIIDGVDAHAMNCTELMELPLTPENRTDAKIFSFRMIYGGTPYAFYMDSKMPNFSKSKWEKIVENFYKKYKGLHKWQKENYREVQRSGQIINPTGRVLKFNKHKSRDGLQYKWAEICNYPVQSLATADIIPLWMVLLNKKLQVHPDIKFIMQVHDEVVFDCPEKDVDLVASSCYNIGMRLPEYIESYFGFEFNVPLIAEVKVGSAWGKLDKYDIKETK